MTFLSNKLTELAQSNVDKIIGQWKKQMQQNLDLSTFSEKNREVIELEARNLLSNLKEWMNSKTKVDIGQRYAKMGAKLFNQGVPLCEIHQALFYLKKLIRCHVFNQNILDSALTMIQWQDFYDQINLFFDRANYYFLRGYTENMNKKIKKLWNLKEEDTEQIFFKNSFYNKD